MPPASNLTIDLFQQLQRTLALYSGIGAVGALVLLAILYFGVRVVRTGILTVIEQQGARALESVRLQGQKEIEAVRRETAIDLERLKAELTLDAETRRTVATLRVRALAQLGSMSERLFLAGANAIAGTDPGFFRQLDEFVDKLRDCTALLS